MKPGTIEEWVAFAQTVPQRLRNASAHMKNRTQEIDMRRTQPARASDMPANPIYILAAITLGLPALALILMVGMNPDIQEGVFMTLLALLIIAAFVVAAIFEIKRLADDSGADPNQG